MVVFVIECSEGVGFVGVVCCVGTGCGNINGRKWFIRLNTTSSLHLNKVFYLTF